MMRITLAVAVVLMLCAATTQAAPITLTYSGTGSGSLGASSFTNTAFVITAVGDTANWFHNTDYTIYPIDVSVTLGNLGTYVLGFTSPSAFWVFSSQTAQMTGLGRNGGGNLIHLFNSQLAAWDMLTSFGPITTGGTLLQWAGSPQMTTSAGILLFDTAGTTVTFQAIVGVPEPVSLALMLAGFAILSARSFLPALQTKPVGVLNGQTGRMQARPRVITPPASRGASEQEAVGVPVG